MSSVGWDVGFLPRGSRTKKLFSYVSFVSHIKSCYTGIMAKNISDLRVVVTSLSVSASDVTLNLLVALATGSTVMLSQALQGLSDFITGGILYIGVKRSKRKADLKYQFGYGREIFFWVLIAGIFMFVGTGSVSFYLGYQQFIEPHPVTNIAFAFGMLFFGFITNLFALSVSVRRLRDIDARKGWWRQLLRSSIVETKATLLIDFLGTLSALLGLTALFAYILTGDVRFDGLGSMVIGLGMMFVSIILIRDVRDLIIGKAVDQDVSDQIIQATKSVKGIRSVLDLRTMYLGSAKMLVIIEVHVQDGLETNQIEVVIDKVKAVVQQNIPQISHIQIEVETPDGE